MNKIKLLTATAIVASAFVATAFAADPMVGGAAMYPSKNIIQNAVMAAVSQIGHQFCSRMAWEVVL